MLIRVTSGLAMRLAVLLAPVLLVAVFGLAKAQLLRLSGPAFWEGAGAGEAHAVRVLGEPAYVLETIAMVRQSGIADYAMTAGVLADMHLRARMIEMAWPIRHVANSGNVLSLAGEDVAGCSPLARTERTRLCARR